MRRFCERLCAFALVALLCWSASLERPSVARAAPSPIGAHSMLQLNDPPSFMERMFAEAAAMHASAIRLDVQPSMVFTDPLAPPDFTGLDEVMELSQQYHLPVVADLLSVPWWIADCGPGVGWAAMPRCGTGDLTDYGSMLGQIVTHADPVIREWEIWNEPDQSGFFSGTPQQYAWMLRAAHDTIKQIDPQASVLLGGISDAAGMDWLAQVFATPGADAAHAFDIANVHERTRLSALAPDIEAWRKFLAWNGFAGPLWVTEHGYPSDSAYQYDPAYAGGESSQAAYLTASIPTLLDAGASEVFVTERDNLGGPFASEGLLGGDVLDPPVADPLVVEKPSYGAVSTLAQCYAELGRDCPGPLPAAEPSSLTLAPTLVGSGTTSAVSVTNPGSEPLLLGQAVFAGAQRTGLGLGTDTCSGQVLEPAQACTVSVHYAPLVGGAVSGTLQVPSENGTLTVPVGATALSVAELTWSKTAFQATGRFDRHGEVQRLEIELANPLAGAVPVLGAAFAPGHGRGSAPGYGRGSAPGHGRGFAPGHGREFALASDGCAHTQLRPGSNCRLEVLFRPAGRGSAETTLTLLGNGATLGSGPSLQIALRAGPFAPPAITRIVRAHNRILVVTDQPAALTWQAWRRGAWAGGRTRSVATGRLFRGTGRSEALLRLPGGLARGHSWLSVSVRNAHGEGTSEAVWLTNP